MSAQQAEVGGLSRAHLRIVRLLDDLDSTVESVEELSVTGNHEEALRLVEEQQRALYEIVELISRDVASHQPSLWRRVRRHGMALAAAALLLVSSVAVSAGIIGGATPPTDDREGSVPPATVDRGAVAPGSNDVPAGSEAPSVVPVRPDGDDPFDGLGRGDIQPPDPGGNDAGILDDATAIAEQLTTGGAPPPQSGENPVGTLQELGKPKEWRSADS